MPDVTLTIPDHLHLGDMTAGIFARLLNQERAAAAESANTEANTLRAELEALKAERARIVDPLNIGDGDDPAIAVQALMTERDNLRREIAELERSNTDQATLLKKALARIEELEAPKLPELPDDPMPDTVPIVTPTDPITTPPKPATRDVFPFCGIYIEDERTVNNLAQAKERADAMIPAMEFAANSGLTDYIFFGNQFDVQLGEIYRTAKRLKKRIWASPVQKYFSEDRPRFIEHLKALHDAGVYGGFVDDAQNIDAKDMPALLNLLNEFLPGAPIVCSFAADFDDSAYPKDRYIDSRQWFTREKEKEGTWFPKWEGATDAQIYTADCWKRSSGLMHPPARIEAAFKTAMPFVQGVAFYSLVNTGKWDHVADHKRLTAQNKDALTVWSVIKACSEAYQKAQRPGS